MAYVRAFLEAFLGEQNGAAFEGLQDGYPEATLIQFH